MRTLILLLSLLLAASHAEAQTKVQRGIARMITRSATDPVVPVAGVQVVVGNVASRASDGNGRFSLNVTVNSEQSYALADVRVPKGTKLVLASPSKKKKLFLDQNDLEVALISEDEKNMVSRANYKTLLRKYNEQAERVRQLREQLEARQAELDENSEEYRNVTATRDSVQALLNLYFDDKTYEQTLKDIESIAEDLALTDYQSLDSIEARIYELKMAGDWPTISDLLIRLMGGNASAWLHDKLDRRNEAAKDFAMGMEMIKEAIEAFKMQHLTDSIFRYYEILLNADSANWENLTQVGLYKAAIKGNFEEASKLLQKSFIYASNDSLKAQSYDIIGFINSLQRKHTISLKYFNMGLELRLRSGAHDIDVSFCNIGFVHQMRKEYEMALNNYQKALAIGKHTNGKNSREVAEIYNLIAGVYSSTKKYRNAIKFYRKTLKILKQLHYYYDISLTYILISNMYNEMNKRALALSYDEKRLKILRENFGETHPDIRDCLRIIALDYETIALEFKLKGNRSKAINAYKKARNAYLDLLNLRIKVLGYQHKDVREIMDHINGIEQNDLK